MISLQLPPLSKIFQKGIMVFDSGIGSYAIVLAIRRILPNAKIVYLADRASFPYGKMPLEILQKNIQSRVHFFENYFQPTTIVLGSNTPSVTVLDQIKSSVPIEGICPPLEEAVSLTKSKCVGVLGTQNLVGSAHFLKQCQDLKIKSGVTIVPVDASFLVELSESFEFIDRPSTCSQAIRKFLMSVFNCHPDLDTLTLSSTHLTFLKPFMAALYPNITYLDPSENLAQQIKMKYAHYFPEKVHSKPNLLVLATENPTLHLYNTKFERGLLKLGCSDPVHSISISEQAH